jgi:predicted RNA-binding protein with EMAP domain
LIDIIVNSVAYGLLVLLIGYLGFRNILLRRKLQEAITDKLQANVNANIVRSEYTRALQEIENMKLEKSDDFVKFLSNSRDWAFEYIEDAQEKISEFDKQIQKIAEWNRTYGSVVGDIPHSSKIEEINLAYDKIRSLLPENKTPNN